MQQYLDQPDLILPSLRATGRKQILKDLAKEIARKIGTREQIVYNRLQGNAAPEQCTMSSGVMIIDMAMGAVSLPFTALARLSGPQDFTAPDGQPVDLVVTLISPDRDKIINLQNLASWSRRMRDEDLLAALRRAEDSEDMFLALAAQNRPQKQAA